MSRSAIDGLLEDFGQETRSAALSQGVSDALATLFGRSSEVGIAAHFSEPDTEPALDLELVREEAREEGRQEARARADEEIAARLAEERQKSDLRLEEARAAWASDTGQRVSDLLRSEFSSLTSELSDLVARVLKPFLAQRVREEAARVLAAEIAGMASNDKSLRFEITGPEDLLAVVREALSPTLPDIGWHTAENIEVRVAVNSTLIETQLTQWLSAIEEAAL